MVWPKPLALPSANITSVIFIGVDLYLRSPIFPFSFCVAASASPPQPAIDFNVEKSSFIFFIFFTTGDCELMATMTNQREIPNVRAQPRPWLARSLRMQDA